MHRTRLTAAAIVAAAVTAAVPSAADAATIKRGSGTTAGVLTYQAAPGEFNLIVAESESPSAVRFKDRAGVPISIDPTAASACRPVAGTGEVRCANATPWTLVNLFAGDQQDHVTPRIDGEATAAGGISDDKIILGTGRSRSRVFVQGGDGVDEVSYADATAPVIVDKAAGNLDGRPTSEDTDKVRSDIEIITGSRFDDRLVGSAATETFRPGAGNDSVTGNGGADRYEMSSAADGSDIVNGNGAGDTVSYAGRTNPVSVALGTRNPNNGEAGERDMLLLVAGAEGGRANDTLSAVTAPAVPPTLNSSGGLTGALVGLRQGVRLDGRDGNDTISGTRLNDVLTGGAGVDVLTAGNGSDRVNSADGVADSIDCGKGSLDIADADAVDNPVAKGCEASARALTPGERRVVGVLELAPKRVRADAGATTPIAMSWSHPQSWRDLRSLELQIMRGDLIVGSIVIAPVKGSVRGRGALSIARGAKVDGKGSRRKVTARFGVKLDRALAGEELTVDVVASDRRGGRQFERAAGRIRVRP